MRGFGLGKINSNKKCSKSVFYVGAANKIEYFYSIKSVRRFNEFNDCWIEFNEISLFIETEPMIEASEHIKIKNKIRQKSDSG